MKTRSLAVAAGLIFFAAWYSAARPRPALPPFPELTLGTWRFDNPNTVGLGAVAATNLWLAESWSGYALDMTGQDSRLLLMPAVAGPGDTNLCQRSGTIRMWISPATWSSVSVGGAGPGEWAILCELGQTNTVDHPFGLALAIDPGGTNLAAVLATETDTVVLAQCPISFATGEWHQVAFVYWPSTGSNTCVSLVVDDLPEHTSTAAIPWPSTSVWGQSAFSLGCAMNGQQGQARFDEIYTFGFPLTTNYLTWNYLNFAPTAVLGPIQDIFIFHAEKNSGEATNFLGFHLGAVTNLNSTNAGTWRWTNSPTGPMNGRGNFDPDCNPPGGSTHTVVGTNLFYVYRGEFWRGGIQACQLFHYDSDGHFIGQFGYPKPVGVFNRPGSAGNMHHFSAVKVNGILYVYTPDEGNHGIHRWRVDE